jgi:pyridoxamine 5'-phosphate oxidase family protein
MSAFTATEQAYLDGQQLGRLATIGPGGAPQVRPVAYVYNREYDTVDIGGHNLIASRKFRNIQADSRVSLAVDDLASTTPWSPRGVEIRGTAEVLAEGPLLPGFDAALIRIHPVRILAWGLDTGAYEPPNARNVGS